MSDPLSHGRRLEAAEGTLSPIYCEGLKSVRAWEKLPSRRGDNEARWARRLLELADYLAAGNEWPRQKGDNPEHQHWASGYTRNA